MTKTLRKPFFAFAAATLLLVGPTAHAEDFPPASENGARPAGTAETPPTGWSPPAVTPGRSARPTVNDPSLPPPRIVPRRGARRTSPASGTSTPMGTTPSAGRMTPGPSSTNPPISVTPRTPRVPATPPAGMSSRGTPGTGTPATVPGTMMPPPPAAPRVPVQPRAPVQPSSGIPSSGIPSVTPPTTVQPGTPVQPTATATGTAGVGGSRIFNITKLHNVPLDRGPGTEQDLALQLDVDYEVRGQNGRDVYVAIWFARKADGALVQAAVPSYRDRQGNATLQTRAARVAGTAARYKATLRIPYRAFPMGAGEASYDVEARVQVLRTEGRGQVTVLCRGSTTFRVYGFEEGEEPAPQDDGIPNDGIPNEVPRGEIVPGVAIPGEGGRISDPGR